MNGKEHKPFITIGAAIGCSICLAVALGAILWVAIIGHHNQNQNCNAALDVRDAVVALLADAQHRTETTPAETGAEKKRQEALQFYNQHLMELKAIKCRGK